MKKLSFTLCLMLVPVITFSKCLPEDRVEFESGRNAAVQGAVKAYLNQASLQTIREHFSNITVNELHLITYNCALPSDRNMVLRDIKITNDMELSGAAFALLERELLKDLGLDLDVRSLFERRTFQIERKL